MATSEQESAKKSSTVSESNKDQEPSKYLIPVLALIKVYQFIVSPLLGNNCRFYPSCSSYTIQALEKHGLLKGTLLSIKRISKCHPWHPGGIDEVPEEYKPCCKSQHH